MTLVTVPEMARILKVEPNTVYSMLSDGRLREGVVRVGRLIRLDPDAVIDGLRVPTA